MRRQRRARPPNRRRPAAAGEPDPPSLIELERFSQASLHQWQAASNRIDTLHRTLFWDLEPLRQRDEQKLLDALRGRAIDDFRFEDWSRIVDYRYSLVPQSVAGSIKGLGGRFNVGRDLSPGTLTPFPAFYVAEDYDTAFREKFGGSPATATKLTAAEIALRKPGSFTQIRLQGRVDLLIDISEQKSLSTFVDVIRQFAAPKSIGALARKLGLRRPSLIRSAVTLQRQLLHPNWRISPAQFGLPANSQIFGRIASAAGLHGILYPSVRSGVKRCLALFPQNWKRSMSFVELADAAPPRVQLVRIDGDSNGAF